MVWSENEVKWYGVKWFWGEMNAHPDFISPIFSRRFMKWNATIIVAFLFFSRRFMKWNATNLVAFRFFFNPHELTKIALQKFYKILLHQIALFGLANWTRKVFPVFPRNIPYPARPKGPFQFFFGTARLFFRKILPLQFFCCFATEWMLENPKGSPFQFFSALWIFFRK